MIDAGQVFAGLPKGLREELLECYNEIMSAYLARRWRASELDGGRFCEIVFSIVEGVLVGTMPTKAYKPAKMLQACQTLEKIASDPKRVGDRSLRILIPRVLPVLYEIRNNRNVGHVGGDVNPDHMDAVVVQSMASWLMAELVRIFHGMSTEQAERTVDALVERKTPLVWEVDGVKRVLDHTMSAKDQTLLLLHHSTGSVDTDQLYKSIEYSTERDFRSKVLKPLHDKRLIEFDAASKRARISPKGIEEVETRILKR